MIVTILARDNDKPGNRELISFLEPNWDALLGSGLKFDLKIVEDSDIPDLIKRGLDKLPVALAGNKTYASSVDIKTFLMRFLQNTTRQSAQRSRDPEEELQEFYRDEMSFELAKKEKENADRENGGGDIKAQYQEEIERRNREMGQKTTTPKRIQKRKDNIRDDEPMNFPEPPQRQKSEKIQGGDPNNADDRRLMDMFEMSDF